MGEGLGELLVGGFVSAWAGQGDVDGDGGGAGGLNPIEAIGESGAEAGGITVLIDSLLVDGEND
jgi:hypothetical protein